MRIKAYNQLFRELASRHIDIKHSEQECHFLSVTLSSDPVARLLDLNEFNSSLKDRLRPGYFMVLQSYEAEYKDNGADTSYLELRYRNQDKPINYNVELVSVPSNLGKGRVWYFLPLPGNNAGTCI